MNFQELTKVESPKFYLDVAFKRAKEKKEPRERMDKFTGYLTQALKKIIHSYPNIDNLPEFYLELVRSQLDYRYLKKSLGAVDWAVNKLKEFHKKYVKNENLKEFYGRQSSVLKKIKRNLVYLEEARRVMKGFPAVKTSLYTVALYGFPNVGKTTLLNKVTDAKAEINSYPFTTKKINIGYMRTIHDKIQVLDTPGTLNREDKMNNIEMQAELALKYCANLIVFVYDPTYSKEKQDKLLGMIRKRFRRKKLVLYATKTDIENPGLEDYVSDPEELKKLINDYGTATR